MFVNKWARQIANGWRNGIVGVEDPEKESTELFREWHEKLSGWTQKAHNTQRQRSNFLITWNGTNSQINFDNPVPRPVT